MTRLHSRAVALLAGLLSFSTTAFAHSGEGVVGGLLSGLLHPISGLDHVVAMVGVGLWGAFIGGRALWLLPVIFPLVMVIGGILGIVGVPVPAVEIGIAASAVAIGLCVAFAVRPSNLVAAIVVGAFAIFHGYAHGKELPEAVNALAYSLGFVVATGLLHLAGIVFGALTRTVTGTYAVRAGGLTIAAIGCLFLASALS